MDDFLFLFLGRMHACFLLSDTNHKRTPKPPNPRPTQQHVLCSGRSALSFRMNPQSTSRTCCCFGQGFGGFGVRLWYVSDNKKHALRASVIVFRASLLSSYGCFLCLENKARQRKRTGIEEEICRGLCKLARIFQIKYFWMLSYSFFKTLIRYKIAYFIQKWFVFAIK